MHCIHVREQFAKSALNSLVPASRLRDIGLQPRGSREYTLADGQQLSLEVTVAELEFEGERVGGTVVYGDEEAERCWASRPWSRAVSK